MRISFLTLKRFTVKTVCRYACARSLKRIPDMPLTILDERAIVSIDSAYSAKRSERTEGPMQARANQVQAAGIARLEGLYAQAYAHYLVHKDTCQPEYDADDELIPGTCTCWACDVFELYSDLQACRA